jgi:multiple antibiotic resistance protein
MTTLSAFLTMFFVMDPLGNIGLFLAALTGVPVSRRRKVIVRELLVALVALVICLFVGRFAMHALSLSEPALTIGGGIILLLIALRMIFPEPDKSLHEKVNAEPFIVPLAIPYVAGPTAIATELLLMTREPHRWAEWLLAVFLAWLATSVILFFSSGMSKVLGERGLIAIERLMGMILITVAVQMFLRGIEQYVAHIK